MHALKEDMKLQILSREAMYSVTLKITNNEVNIGVTVNLIK